ncbi:MAG: hypothetical protein OEV44_13180 [Spirochaetota bacterium]|nr:hypothetical protein [Spirochaetota bacterium]
MKSKLLVIIAFLIALPIVSYSNNIYHVVGVSNNADFDYEMINKIDSYKVPYPKDSHFQIGDLKTKKGKFKIIKLINAYYGVVSYSKNKILIHDILLLKVDKKSKVLDAYHYTLEWSDSPSIRLFKMKAKNVYLRKELKLKDLKLVNNNGNELGKLGIIDNVYNSKKVF